MAQDIVVTVDAAGNNVIAPVLTDIGANRSVVFVLSTAGYVLTSVSVPGFTCSLSGDGTSATCTQTGTVSPNKQPVTLQVRSAGGKDLPVPDVWIQNT
jgi:hypothetical protein